MQGQYSLVLGVSLIPDCRLLKDICQKYHDKTFHLLFILNNATALFLQYSGIFFFHIK